MPQYMLSVWHDQEYDLDFSSHEAQRQVAQVTQFNTHLESEGAFVFACGLLPVSAARVARPEGDELLVTDGPYAESKEHIGGFWIIEVGTAAEATSWAERAAQACERPVELREAQGE